MSHAHHALEAAKTVVEVAELAWTATEHFHHHHHKDHNQDQLTGDRYPSCLSAEEVQSIRAENQHLRELLEKNLELLHKLADSPSVINDCPPDLHYRLLTAVNSTNFLNRLHSLHSEAVDGKGNAFPFKEPAGEDLDAAEILVNVDKEEPSWWVWVTDDMVPGRVEERSGLDNDSYVIVWEEHVVDGVANFVARCILSNPKAQNMTPEELQKTVTKSLEGVNKLGKMLHVWHAGKLFYVLATWGLAFGGLYQNRTAVKLAAKGVYTTGKFVMRAL